MTDFDSIIIGAGAAGMMCALEAGKRGLKVLLLDHAMSIGEKIRISGGGRCNFTNLRAGPENYLSENPHFCKSALKRYRPTDFVELIKRHGIAFHEKEKGQLFCNDSAQQIIDMLLRELQNVDIKPKTEQNVQQVERDGDGFRLVVNGQSLRCRTLVVATGGKSIPKTGASGFAFKLAEQFGLNVIKTRPALVPLTFDKQLKQSFEPLAGVSLMARVSCNKKHFLDPLLFTHRGLSGPSILQISSYWREGDALQIDLAPTVRLDEILSQAALDNGKLKVQTVLAQHLPKRLALQLCRQAGVDGHLAELSKARLQKLAALAHGWRVTPVGSEGYRTAEVTLGGVDANELSSKTFEARKVKGLHFIGEAVDVTGQLGGYNFQWAWSSGWCAGNCV